MKTSSRSQRFLASSSFLLMVALSLVAQGAAQDASRARLELQIEGVEVARGGPVLCALYRDAQGFPLNVHFAVATTEAPARGRTLCVFENLPPGTYAAAVHHDHDRDLEVDRNLFGQPTEGWGSTRDVTHTFSPPGFDESSVNVTAPTTRVTVHMHY